ncbi:MAG: hypothetical protein BMS9Abin28_2096 [Anaerolineae bacterium]|nr:MAG: hypothetical protein BMS9Abin28_2096 [Anaerolineae bacterium]
MKVVDSKLNTPLECDINVEAVETPSTTGPPIGSNIKLKEENSRKSFNFYLNSRLGQVVNGYPEEEE